MAAMLALAGAAVLTLLLLDTAAGHRFVARRIADYAPASGLRITVGRIDGSLYGKAVLRDVLLADPQGTFARVPETRLDWRPFHWFASGLDIRSLGLHRAKLLRLPRMRPGDPDAPLLPGFDIRIDRLEIDDLKVAQGVLGAERRVQFTARADIRQGRALIRAEGRLGGTDRLFALLDAEAARDRFDVKLDYAAPKGGLLAGLAGADKGFDLIVGGKGGWQRWDGALVARQDGRTVAAFRLGNRAGLYSALGQAWPAGWLQGLAAKAAGPVLSLDASARLDDGVLDGRLGATSAALRISAKGKADLTENRFDAMRIVAEVRDPDLLGGDVRLDGALLAAGLNGPFRDLAVEHSFTAARVGLGSIGLEKASTAGIGRFDGARWTLPVDLLAERIVTGSEAIDPRLIKARLRGTLDIAGGQLTSRDLAFDAPGLGARLQLRGDLRRSAFALDGTAAARGWPLTDIGLVDADGRLALSLGKDAPWRLTANFTGRMARIDNDTVTTVSGGNLRFSGSIEVGQNLPLIIAAARIDSHKLALALSGRRLADGSAAVSGSGRHTDYGPFRLALTLGKDGRPLGELLLADPWPAGGLKDVRLALSPLPEGFRIETVGGSALGPFNGTLGLYLPREGAVRLEVERLDVWQTRVTGSLALGGGAASGALALAGGGIDGTMRLAPRSGGQGIDIALSARNARFGGDRPVTIGSGSLEASGLLVKDHTTLSGSATGQGIAIGSAFIGKLSAKARLVDGRGEVDGTISGQRGSRFALRLHGDIAPGQLAVRAAGELAGRPIAMPRSAVLTREADGWRLARSQITIGGGSAIGEGLLGAEESDFHFALTEMPLSLADVFMGTQGLGGTASGLLDYRKPRGGMPGGNASLQIKGLTRAGLVLTSRPVDVSLIGTLSAGSLETRAVLRDGGALNGRLQARITQLPGHGTLGERLRQGRLFAQLRYGGPADALWRLIALDEFDLTGPLTIAADARGTVADPQISGSLASDNLRLRSALTGTDISAIAARGRFSGPRLEVTSFSGRTGNDGRVTGSGSFDLSGIGTRGPAIDLRIAAQRAQVLATPDMAATVTGPLRIVSNGVNGTIAGRLRLTSGQWRLGRATAQETLPSIRTREINRRADIAMPRVAPTSWRYLIDAAAPNRIAVRGLGLDSEWSADIRLRGTTRNPAIEGSAALVRGGYEFAGKRFALTRGRITFHGESPPDPRIDIGAEAIESGVTARVTVTGTSLRPEIRFSSTPALPEEELLSRLLFGTSINKISAPEALQLGAALASLRGGGGLDPINKLRRSIGLDRLRIVSADAASGRSTGLAAGKYLGRRFYVEIVTDGRGYSATQLEFRLTGWLTLLASVSSIGRESMNIKVSKDY